MCSSCHEATDHSVIETRSHSQSLADITHAEKVVLNREELRVRYVIGSYSAAVNIIDILVEEKHNCGSLAFQITAQSIAGPQVLV
jgi:hypothetical protein